MNYSCLQIPAIFVVALMNFVPSSNADDSRTPTASFVNDVMPILTKAGCNAGTCHAKAGGGQNGFQLSLLGFEPVEDYTSIVQQSRGRRVFLHAPENSLLLKKATGTTPHGGGVRLETDSPEYEAVLNWIQQGARNDLTSAPTLVALQVEPSNFQAERGSTQQLIVIAKYSDGTTLDVTTRSLFESNSTARAKVTDHGLVRTTEIPGSAAIMVRYQGKTATAMATISLDATVENLPTAVNYVDEHVFKRLKDVGIPPSELCDDETFLRRVTIDIAGRLPTIEETESFLASKVEKKRSQVIDRLLSSPGYADYFANKWTTLLKNRRDDASDITSNFAFHAWLRDSLLENKPYDQIVRELLAATGTVVGNPPVAWYKRVKDPKDQLEDVSQLFLGVRLQCAQCHHHPFERWSQDDYYSLSAFFSRVGRKPTGVRGEDLIFHQRGIATAKNVRSGIDLKPKALGDDVGEISADEDPRLKLADWMKSPRNPFFAKAVVNRYWKHFFKTGLIEPEDDIRDTNPPSNPELLSALEKQFIESEFDLKELVRTITNSTTYQLSSKPNSYNIVDNQNYSRFYPRRLQAEVLFDSIDDVTGAKTTFANLPPGTRAIALPDNSYNKSTQFLRVFGRPDSTSVCECERVQSSSLAQSLHLINSSEMKSKLTYRGGRIESLAKDEIPITEKVEKLYLSAFSRKPTEREIEIAVKYLEAPAIDASEKPVTGQQALKQNLMDLAWALMNTKEFMFNH